MRRKLCGKTSPGNHRLTDFFETILRLRPRTLAPLRLAKITFARIGPSAPIAIKDFAQFVKHFCSNPKAPAGERFARGSGRAFLFPSSTHCGNF